METLTMHVPDNFNLFLFGDGHEGSVLRHDKGWEQLLTTMLNEYDGLPPECNFGIDHGDIIEAIMVDDKRYSMETTKESSILSQINNAVRQRERIKDKLITVLDGNHPYKLRKFGDITKTLCERLDAPYGTYSCIITYKSKGGATLFKHYVHHGFGSLKSSANPYMRKVLNKQLSLRNKFSEKFGDCLLNSMGHTHQLIVVDPIHQPYLTTDKDGKLEMKYTKPSKRSGYIDPDHRWYVNTGGFYRAYEQGITSYIEMGGYNPVELGFLVAKIRDRNITDIDKIIVG